MFFGFGEWLWNHEILKWWVTNFASFVAISGRIQLQNHGHMDDPGDWNTKIDACWIPKYNQHVHFLAKKAFITLSDEYCNQLIDIPIQF